MFAIHGLSGLSLRAPLEQLSQALAVRRLRDQDTDADPVPVGDSESVARYEAAAGAYRSMLPQALERGPVKHAWQVMSRRVISVRPDDSIEKAWSVLVGEHIRQALVMSADREIIGLVSERDLLTALNVEAGHVRDVLSKRVADVMVTPVVSADPVTDVRRIAQALLEYGLSGLPVVEEGGKAVGFISRGDILRSVIKDPPLNLWT